VPLKPLIRRTERTNNQTNEVGESMTQEPIRTLPLLFSFRERVVGNGFLAEVKMEGRALLEVDSCDGVEETWITGVEPAGIAGGGAGREAAFREFHKSWLTALFDLAEETTSFEGFQQEVCRFLGSKVESISKRWSDAVQEVRARHYQAQGLPRGSADRAVVFEVAELTLQAELNDAPNGPHKGTFGAAA